MLLIWWCGQHHHQIVISLYIVVCCWKINEAINFKHKQNVRPGTRNSPSLASYPYNLHIKPVPFLFKTSAQSNQLSQGHYYKILRWVSSFIIKIEKIIITLLSKSYDAYEFFISTSVYVHLPPSMFVHKRMAQCCIVFSLC